MTDTSPEPDTTDPATYAPERLGGSIQAEAVYERPSYSGEREGPGRWVAIETHGEPLGIVWVTDALDGIGFVPTTEAGRRRVPEFVRAFQDARKAGAPLADVWDYWSHLGGLGLCALPEVAGDLTTLDTLTA